jgi:hypothetical protein
LLLLPVAFLLHIAEEHWAAEGLVKWTARLTSTPISTTRFIAINAIGWPVFAFLALIAVLQSRFVWLAATLSTLLLFNAFLHALGTAVTAAYSPGLVTGLLLYPPVCIAALRYTRKLASPGEFAAAICGGFILHGFVLLAAFGQTNQPVT